SWRRRSRATRSAESPSHPDDKEPGGMTGRFRVFARKKTHTFSFCWLTNPRRGFMKKKLAAFAVLFLLGAAGPVLADNGKGLFIARDVDPFAVLPQGVTNPEGITATPANGDISVSTFVALFKFFHYNRHGRLLAELDFAQPL